MYALYKRSMYYIGKASVVRSNGQSGLAARLAEHVRFSTSQLWITVATGSDTECYGSCRCGASSSYRWLYSQPFDGLWRQCRSRWQSGVVIASLRAQSCTSFGAVRDGRTIRALVAVRTTASWVVFGLHDQGQARTSFFPLAEGRSCRFPASCAGSCKLLPVRSPGEQGSQ